MIDDHIWPRLQERFDFTTEDLEANRNGEFTDRQRAGYEAKRLPLKSTALVTAVSLLFGWIALTDHRRRSADFRRDRGLELLPLDWSNGLLGFFVPLILALALIYGMWWFLFRWPLRRGPKAVSGPARYIVKKLKYSSVPAVEIGKGVRGRWFVVTIEDEELFSHIPYATLFYSQGAGKTVVHSIETMAPPH